MDSSMEGPYTTLRDIPEGLQNNVSHGYLCIIVYCSTFTYNTKIVGLTRVSINRGLDKENTVHIHSHKEE